MRISATTTALHNAVADSVSRAGVWSRARSVLLRSVAAGLAVVAVQQAASAQWVSGPLSGTYVWSNTDNWVGGLITNTISAASTTGANPITFQMTGTTLTTGINYGPSGAQQPVTFQATTGTQTISLSSGTMLTVSNVANNSSSFSNNLVLDLAHSGTSVFNLPATRTFTIASKITGAGALRLSAALDSTVYVSNTANDWTGGLIINAPTLFNAPVSGTFAPIAGSVTMESVGRLHILGQSGESRFFIVNNLSGAAGSVSLAANPNFQSGTVAFNSTVSSTFAGGVLTASDLVRNRATMNVWKQGSGTLSLTGSSTYYGRTSILDGTLDIAKITDAGVTGLLTASGTINTPSSMAGIQVGMRVWSQDGSTYTAFVTATTATTFTTSAALANNQNFVMGFTENNLGISTSSTSNLIFSGGRLRYSGSASGSTNRLFSIGTGGGGIIADGTTGQLLFTGGGTIGFNGQSGARVFTLSGTNTGTNTLTTALADNGGQTALIKSGLGRWVLGGSHAYTGTTRIDAGRLTIDAGASIGSSRTVVVGTAAGSGARLDVTDTAYTFTGGQTLMGSGTVAGGGVAPTTVTINGTLSPGNSPGLLTFDNTSLALGSTGNVIMEISGSTRGTQYDAIDITGGANGGGLTYGGMMTLNFTQTFTSGTFNLFKFDLNETSGAFSSVVFDPASQYTGSWGLVGDVWKVTTNDNTVMEFRKNVEDGGVSYGQLVIVPEPLTLGLLGIGSGIAVVGLRHLRRRKANGTNGTSTSDDTADKA